MKSATVLVKMTEIENSYDRYVNTFDGQGVINIVRNEYNAPIPPVDPQTYWQRRSNECETHIVKFPKPNETPFDYMCRINFDELQAAPASICIDGQSCCGKTTLLGENCLKVTQYFSFNAHNYQPQEGLEYIIQALKVYRESVNCCIDRSPVSNFVYMLVYYLRDRFLRLSDENGVCEYSAGKLCDDFIKLHNLQSVLDFFNALHINTLIVIDSDVEEVSRRMEERGFREMNKGDLAKCSDLLYLRCQAIAFSYVAKQLGYPVIDLSFYRKWFQVTDNALFMMLKREMDKYRQNIEPNDIIKPPICKQLPPAHEEEEYVVTLAISNR